LVGVLAAAFLLTGCTIPSFGAYHGATTQGRTEYHLWQGFFIAGLVVGGFVLLLIIWAVVKYRRKTEEIPKQTQYHTVLEIVYTVVPIVIVLVLFVFTVLAENKVDATPSDPGATISVEAFQWGWEFNYPGGVKVIGETTEAPTMMVPTGSDVEIHLKSLDVLHGFYVPQFNFRRAPLGGLPGPVHPTLRALPLADVLQCEGRVTEPVRQLAANPAGHCQGQSVLGSQAAQRRERQRLVKFEHHYFRK